MGDPRRQRRKFARPSHLWKMSRVTEENELCKKYGLKNKREIWRAKATVGRFRRQARKLLAATGDEVIKEKTELLERLSKLGLIKERALESVLSLKVDDLLERRLQTIVFRKGLTKTIKGARQLVVHRHVVVGNNVVDAPRYLVSKDEEPTIKLRKSELVIKDEGKEEQQKG